ncbi:MAG: copper amine oxidase [Selenomonadaceae bacterium]|nr:copper amine oxidase [Selenomonadaceae bacterium]
MISIRKIAATALALITSLSITMPSVGAKAQRPSSMMHNIQFETFDTGGTLIFSDSPEYVKDNGILYSDVVSGSARLLYYHLNDSTSDKKLAVIVENVSDQFNTLNITRGAATKPGRKFLSIGKAVLTSYLKNNFRTSLTLNRNERKLLRDNMNDLVLKPGQLAYGLYDFNVDYPVRITVMMYPATADPLFYYLGAQVLPKDEQQLRGTFKEMTRVIRTKKKYDPQTDGIVYLLLSDGTNDQYKIGIDATDGSSVVNFGNYGIDYRLELETRDKTQFYLSPLGGMYAGAMRSNYKGHSQLILVPRGKTYFGDETPKEPANVHEARQEGIALLTAQTELADLGTFDGKVQFEYSPPAASYLPINIILMPADD